MRTLRFALALQLLFVPALAAQSPRWKVKGDTTGAPAGCSTAAAIEAISNWFTAYNAADSAGLARSMAPRRTLVFSAGKFTRTDSFVVAHTLPAILQYARIRASHHERLTLDGVRFYPWRGRELGFLPYYSRSADDLGPRPLPGIAKAQYSCARGIIVFNMAPRPTDDPGVR